MALKYKTGDQVRIKSLDWYNKNIKNNGIIICGSESFTHPMSHFCDKVVTIVTIQDDCYRILEDDGDWYWTDEMFEGLVEEETKPSIIEEAKTYWDSIKDAWICPDGYVFKDENGNTINAQKIVLEKKRRDVNPTQEQINTMVHDSCVLFCKHCGCGIPRETCTSLGTCKEHDEYRNAIRTHLLGKKEKNYPKTYEECCKVLGFDEFLYTNTPTNNWYKWKQFHALNRLFICRDAYWKVAGDTMGLGKPWEPDWKNQELLKYCIASVEGRVKTAERYIINTILAFPTEEMRDAFYENFNELIESVKELL